MRVKTGCTPVHGVYLPNSSKNDDDDDDDDEDKDKETTTTTKKWQ